MSNNSQTLKIKIEADSSKATKEIKKNTKAVKDLKDTTTAAAASMSKSFDNISESAKNGAAELQKSIRQQTNSIERLPASISASARNIIRSLGGLAALKKVGSMILNGLKAVWQRMSDIGDKAAELGTTPEAFQKLKKAAKECGASMDDVSSAFKSINQTAARALGGDNLAAAALRRVGIEAENLRGLAPEQVFQQVATALTYMGDSAAEQEAKVAVCGDAVERLSGSLLSLSSAGGMGDVDIISDENVRAVRELQDAVDDLQNSLLSLVASIPFASAIKWVADKWKEGAEEIRTLRHGLPKREYEEWNDVNVSEEKKQEYQSRYEKELRRVALQLGMNPQDAMGSTSKFSEDKYKFLEMYSPVLRPYKGYANQIQYALRSTGDNPDGFMPVGTASARTQKEMAETWEKSQKDKDARELAELRRLYGSGDDDMKAKIAEYEAAMQKRIEKTKELTLAAAPGKVEEATIDHDYASQIREMSRSKKTAADQSALGSQLEELRKTPLQKQEEKDKKVIEEMRAQASGNEELLKKVSEYEQELKKAREERYAEKPPSVAASQTQRGWRSPVRNLSRLHLEEQRKTTRAIKDADQAARKAAQKPEGEKERKVIRVTGSHEIGGNDPDYTNKEKRYLELRNLGLLDQARMAPGRFQTQEKILSAIARKLDAMRSGVYVVKGGGSSK